MPSASSSGAGVPLAESGSSEPCASPPSAAELSLIEALRALVQQLTETNVHLLVLLDQNAKTLQHIAFLIDLVAMPDEDEDTESARMYLDGTPIL